MGQHHIPPNALTTILEKIRDLSQLASELTKPEEALMFDTPSAMDKSDEPAVEKISDEKLAQIAKKLSRARRLREKEMPEQHPFHDPAWDILLDIFPANVNKQKISVKYATMAGHTSATTALRNVWVLEQSGLIARTPDPTDARRQFLDMTAAGLRYMRIVLTEYASIGA